MDYGLWIIVSGYLHNVSGIFIEQVLFDIKRRQSYDIRAVDFEPPYFDLIIAHII